MKSLKHFQNDEIAPVRTNFRRACGLLCLGVVNNMSPVNNTEKLLLAPVIPQNSTILQTPLTEILLLAQMYCLRQQTPPLEVFHILPQPFSEGRSCKDQALPDLCHSDTREEKGGLMERRLSILRGNKNVCRNSNQNCKMWAGSKRR